MYHPNWQSMLETLSNILSSLDHSLKKSNYLNKSNCLNCLRSMDVHPRHNKKPSHRQKNQEEDPQGLKTKQRLITAASRFYAIKRPNIVFYRPNLFDREQLCVNVVIKLTPSSEFEPDRTSHGGLGLFIE